MKKEPEYEPHLLIAHRGESYDAPENTLASVNLAWERNDDAVEIDIHLTRDNHIVVIHDASTKRTGNKKLKVKSTSLEKLKNVDVGSFKNPEWKNERIPLLSEILQTLSPGKKLIIEIKSHRKIIPFMKKELDKLRISSEQVQIISFSLATVKEAKKNFPENKVLWLLNLDYNWLTSLFSMNWKRLLKKAKKYHLDGVDVFAGKRITPTFVRKAKSLNLLVYTWTVDEPEVANRIFETGADAITTNRCFRLKQYLNQ